MIRLLRKASRSLTSRTVLLRLDFNTADEWRLRSSLGTIRFLLARQARVVIISHRGRPLGVTVKGGKPRGRAVREFTLQGDTETLSRLLGRPVVFFPHFRFGEMRRAIASSPLGSVFLLENLRFLPGEEKNSPTLARQLASLADCYVNDAFAVSHRADASVAMVPKYLSGFAGLEFEEELRHLSRIRKNPKHPFVLVVGGAKAHDKLGILRYFARRADSFLLGGGSANTLLELRGVSVGASLVDREAADQPMLRAAARFRHLLLPIDWRTDSRGRILDIGPKTEKLFIRELARARTILWSGPMGYIEDPRYARGNLAVARAIARNAKAFSVTGGGETVSFLKKHKLDGAFGFISTGGGALLDFLAGEKLPGVLALHRRPKTR